MSVYAFWRHGVNPIEATSGENLLHRDTYVATLAQALTRSQSIANVPGLLKQIIDGDMWRKRICKQTGKEVEFRRFADFVAAYPPEGLGTELPVLRDICRRDPAALDALAQVEVGPHGGDRKSEDIKGDNVTLDASDRGNSATYTMRRLAKDVPALHAKVLAGELSPNAAAIEAGFRPKKFQMPSDPAAAARYLAQRVDAAWWAAFDEARGELP